jgi:hypothetical protein
LAPHHARLGADALADIYRHWWGEQRVDLSLYCPDGVAQFPNEALPTLLHASYWESLDVCAFVLRHFLCRHRTGGALAESPSAIGCSSSAGSASLAVRCSSLTHNSLDLTAPAEKWLRKRTSYKIKSATANHRANDVIVNENEQQTIVGRFMYGPLDVVTLSGEKVDIYVKGACVCTRLHTFTHGGCAADIVAESAATQLLPALITTRPTGSTDTAFTDNSADNSDIDAPGTWMLIGTALTDANGRATFTVYACTRVQAD